MNSLKNESTNYLIDGIKNQLNALFPSIVEDKVIDEILDMNVSSDEIDVEFLVFESLNELADEFDILGTQDLNLIQIRVDYSHIYGRVDEIDDWDNEAIEAPRNLFINNSDEEEITRMFENYNNED